MVRIYIDNSPYDVKEGKNLLEACLSLKLDLPYFCWHPALGSVGACRQCAVKQYKSENDTRGKTVMACMTSVSQNTRISILDPETQAFRASVIEWLMINHPHDCPVCDEGGECHLQDMTLMTGHVHRRFRFRKRTFQNQYLGPFVHHEMNRCIACYRCVRFYRDYAGGHDLNVFGTHDRVYFGRHEDGILESEFSGNLVEVCPTGVFTDKTLQKHYTRKWDLQTAPSVCSHCSLGCNTFAGERYGTLRRIQNRYHHDINGYFICDRGRYGYGFVNSDKRSKDIWLRPARNEPFSRVAKAEVDTYLGSIFSNPASVSRTIGIGSPRASLEANFALRTWVGAPNFYHGMSEVDGRLVSLVLDILRAGPVASASLREVEQADTVFILGEDITNTAPRLALAVRQSIRNLPMELSRRLKIPDWQDAAVREVTQEGQGPLFVSSAYQTKLDEVATQTYWATPDNIARLGFAVASAIAGENLIDLELSDEVAVLAREIAEKLLQAKRPVIISGTGLRSETVLKAAANVAWALSRQKSDVRVSFTVPEANSLGVGLMTGNSLSDAFQKMDEGTIDSVIVLENDLFRRAESLRVKSFLTKAKRVILIDHVATAMTARADLILPAATFAETDGTLVNNEGRALRFYQVFVPGQLSVNKSTEIRAGWRWVRELMIASGRMDQQEWSHLDEVVEDLAESLPALRQVLEAAPRASFRISGNKIPRQPHRYSGRTAIVANITLQEPKPPEDPDTPLSFSMEGFEGEPPAPLIPRFWAPGWNSVQAVHKFQSEIGAPLRGGPNGKRLIEPAPQDHGFYFNKVPQAFVPEMGRWFLLPIYHIFGSEELSMLSTEIAGLAPATYVALNSDDASSLNVVEGDILNVSLDTSGEDAIRLSLAVRLKDSLPHGSIGIPFGLSGLEGMHTGFLTWCTLTQHKLAGAA